MLIALGQPSAGMLSDAAQHDGSLPVQRFACRSMPGMLHSCAYSCTCTCQAAWQPLRLSAWHHWKALDKNPHAGIFLISFVDCLEPQKACHPCLSTCAQGQLAENSQVGAL